MDNQEFEEQYDLLFNSMEVNKDVLKESTMKATDLNIDKELAQSKINISLNEEKYFLSSRKWDYLDSSKYQLIEDKYNLIVKKMNKKQLQSLNSQIEKCKLDKFYDNLDPRHPNKRIGPVSSMDYLIETTYFSQENYIHQMFNDKEILQKYAFKFRNILGDGDCFFRGLIFSILENIILTNNIMIMKEISILFNEKISLENPLVKENDFLKKEIKKMNLSIVTQILYIIINYMEMDNTSETYIILLKVFLYCEGFDFGIIYFTRYLLYEYISSNENKIYSKENQIELGCFLPEEFTKDKGAKTEYFFKKYYSTQLMVPKTFAEKIVIYIAPFVFDCEINILIYEFDIQNGINEKKFGTEKKTNFQVNLIFRKSHYDMYYKKDFYERYSEKLDALTNIKEEIKFLNLQSPEEYYDKLISQNQDNDNDGQNDDNNLNASKCMQCKKHFFHAENPFGLCNDCLLEILKTELFNAYTMYIKSTRNYNDNKLESFLYQYTCTISIQENIPLMNAIINSRFKLKDLLSDIIKNMCLYCAGGLVDENDYIIEFPCGCRICKKKDCLNGFMKTIEKNCQKIEDEETGIVNCYPMCACPCGTKYNLQYILSIINILEEKKMKEQYIEIYYYLIACIWKWKCMICGKNFNPDKKYYRILFNDDNLKKILKKKLDFKHTICIKCLQSSKINEKKDFQCKFCNSRHIKTDIKNVDECNKTESDCIII